MPRPQRIVRKTMRISQDKLERAQKILGTTSETETVDAALDMIAFREEVLEGVRQMAGSNRIRDIYAEDEDEDGLRSGHESQRRRKPQSRSGRQPDRLL